MVSDQDRDRPTAFDPRRFGHRSCRGHRHVAVATGGASSASATQVMMNLVTGVFVDGAQRIAREEKNQERRRRDMGCGEWQAGLRKEKHWQDV